MLRITAVSYLNTFPFVYGIKRSGRLKNYQLDLHVPSECARRLKEGLADVALVPVGALPTIGEFHIITNQCIGATGQVKTVLLLSRVPLEKMSCIYLDFDSRTSVELVRILAAKYWNISPEWKAWKADLPSALPLPESIVAIGDKTFKLRNHYPFVYDLAECWLNFTDLPFVFAVWVSKKKMEEEVLEDLSAALAFGVDRREESLEYFRDQLPECGDCHAYLKYNISYELDDKKRSGLQKFLGFLKE